MLRTALNVFGEPITYTRDATVVALSKAVFDQNYQTVDPNTGTAIISDNPMLGVALADLPGGEWQEGDLATVRGVQYRVVDSQKDSEGHSKLILHRLP
jgi:hypothetical protein